MERLTNYVSFDVEFNQYQGQQQIIQLSGVKYSEGKEVAFFDSYVYTDTPLKSFINGLTGITQEKIQAAPSVEQVLTDFAQFVGQEKLIGYNGKKSDLPILKANGLDLEAQYALDVYLEARERRSKDLNGILNLQLHTVADFLGVARKSHDSLEDARMTALVYEAFLELDRNKSYLVEQEEMENHPFGNLNLADFLNE